MDNNMLPAAKRARTEDLERELRRKNEELWRKDAALELKDAALKAAIGLVCTRDRPNSWEEMPPELREDPTAVTEAIVAGLFPYLQPPFLKRDNIPQSMLQQYVLPELLRNHRDVALRACASGLLEWEEVKPTQDEWRQSEKLSKGALRRGLLAESNDLAADAHPDLTPAVLVQMIREDPLRGPPLLWERIPVCLRGDREFCRSLFELDDSILLRSDFAYHLVPQIFALHPELRQDRWVWENMLNHGSGLDIHTMFGQGLVPDIPDIVRLACQKNPFLLEYIDQQAHEEIVKEIVNHDVLALYHVLEQFIDRNRQFFASKLLELGRAERAEQGERLGRDFGVSGLADAIPTEMWSDDDFALTWLMAGLPLVNTHPAAWRADRAKLLLVAEHSARRSWTLSSFRIMDQALRDDVEFLTMAMGHEPAVFQFASEELRDDVEFITEAMGQDPAIFEFASQRVREGNFKLAIWALTAPSFVSRCLDAIRQSRQQDAAGHPQLGFGLFGPPPLSQAKMEEIYTRAAGELVLHRAFVKFLCGVHLSGEMGLGMLQQSPKEPGFLQTIANFAGVPRNYHPRNGRDDDHLRNLRGALGTLGVVAAEPQYEGVGWMSRLTEILDNLWG